MACRTNEVQASVHTQVMLLASVRLLLLPHIRLMLIVNEIDNRCPRVAVVDVVTKSGGVDDSELRLELFLLELSFDDLDLG